MKPVPYLQTLNILGSVLVVIFEWPLNIVRKTNVYRSFVIRFLVLPIIATMALFLHQGTDSAIFYLIGIGVYIYAWKSGKVDIFPASIT